MTCERRFALQLADESTLRHLCTMHDVPAINAHYEEQVVLTLRMKLRQAQAFEQVAFNALKGAVAVLDLP